MGRLTTHVLDTVLGQPAAGLTIELYQLSGRDRHLIKTVITNGDGRVDSPLLDGTDIAIGRYELLFKAGAYLKAAGHNVGDLPFLDEIPIVFGIDDPEKHFHVPLLLSPYSYSTYRGS